MFVIEIFLPVHDNAGQPFPRQMYDDLRAELTARFGGVTAFLRAPAIGVWKDDTGTPRRDEIVVFEVMAGELDRHWWQGYRARLEREFRQEEVLVRATPFERL